MHSCTHKGTQRGLPTCRSRLPNYYQLLYINKLWHKSSDESDIPNTLEMLPRVAYYRPLGQIDRGVEWRGRVVRGKLQGDREKVKRNRVDNIIYEDI